MKQQLLLIDGENFVHSLVHELKQAKVITNRQQLQRIDPNILFKQLRLDKDAETRYYTTKIQIKSSPAELLTNIQRIRKWNDRWVPYLANFGVKFVKAGTLRVRDAKKCRKCGHKGYVLLEKGVDVRLAVDIVTLADKNTTIFVVSSDHDLLASLHAARQRGATIVYVKFDDGIINYAIAKAVDRTIVLTKNDVMKAFKVVNE